MKSIRALLILVLLNFLSLTHSCNYSKVKDTCGFITRLNNVTSLAFGNIKVAVSKVIGRKPQKDAPAEIKRPSSAASPNVRPHPPSKPQFQSPPSSSRPSLPPSASELRPSSRPSSDSRYSLPPTSDSRPFLSPTMLTELDIKNMHLTRIGFGDLKLKWKVISGAHHYKVQVYDFYVDNETVSIDVPRTEIEKVIDMRLPGPFQIRVSAFSSSGDSNLIANEATLVAVAEAAESTMEIKEPAVDANQHREAKKGDWKLEWEEVTNAIKYSYVVAHDGKVVDVDVDTPVKEATITSDSLGRHDILLIAWQDIPPHLHAIAWGKGYVTITE